MTRKLLLSAAILFLSFGTYAQVTNEYSEWISKAGNFYKAKRYRQSAEAFTQAFAANGGKGLMPDRYNAACVWARVGIKDSAFFQLNRIATKVNYSDYNQLVSDSDLVNLHDDKRWNELCDLVKQNKEKAEAHLNKPLVAILDSVNQNDQKYRAEIENVEKKYGMQSREMTNLWKTINYYDSLDLIKVVAIFDQYGWPGPDVVGDRGSQTIFFVIQHSNIETQDKYLPVVREAVKNKKLEPGLLALLEDRVALGHGKKQIYGSQIHGDPNGHPWVAPLEDPDNVDKRRAQVGLGPLADYVQQWNIKWDVEEYKKQLPEIEKKDKW